MLRVVVLISVGVDVDAEGAAEVPKLVVVLEVVDTSGRIVVATELDVIALEVNPEVVVAPEVLMLDVLDVGVEAADTVKDDRAPEPVVLVEESAGEPVVVAVAPADAEYVVVDVEIMTLKLVELG